MPTITIDIAPDILSWVVSMPSFEQAVGGDVEDKIEAWIRGDKKPTINQIEAISAKMHVPLGYFFLKTPPTEALPILGYRTIDSVGASDPSRNLIDTVFYLEGIKEWMRNYLIEIGSDPLKVVGSCKRATAPFTIANAIRNDIGIDLEWYCDQQSIDTSYNYLRKKLSDSGIIVMMSGVVGTNTRRKLNIDEFRAITLHDDYSPLIFINANDSKGGMLFSLIHEAAHIWLGESNFFNDRYCDDRAVSPLETICNAIAAEVLVPNAIFISKWKEEIGKNNKNIVSGMAKIFNCGVTTIARRALENNFITRQQYLAIAQGAMQAFLEQQKKPSGGDYYTANAKRLDHHLIIAVDNSVREGKTSYTDAYRLTNTSRKTFPSLVEKVRGRIGA